MQVWERCKNAIRQVVGRKKEKELSLMAQLDKLDTISTDTSRLMVDAKACSVKAEALNTEYDLSRNAKPVDLRDKYGVSRGVSRKVQVFPKAALSADNGQKNEAKPDFQKVMSDVRSAGKIGK